MTIFIHLAPTLERQLERTSDYNKKGHLAILKCRQLLLDLKMYGPNHESVMVKRTRHGEHRIKNCVKYDMGSGYRLVTVMNGNYLFVTFLGSHDETDLWFDRHKGDSFNPENPIYDWELLAIDENGDSQDTGTREGVIDHDLYERELEAKLDDNVLLSIFSGLDRNSKDVAGTP